MTTMKTKIMTMMMKIMIHKTMTTTKTMTTKSTTTIMSMRMRWMSTCGSACATPRSW